MNIINICSAQKGYTITLGRRGENAVTEVVFDFTAWVREFGEGTVSLLIKRSLDTNPYPVSLTIDGETATWLVSSTDTATKGNGLAEFTYTVGEKIAKSVVFNTTVLPDIGEPGDPPDPYEDWLETLTDLANQTDENAHAAEQAQEKAEQAQAAAEEAIASFTTDATLSVAGKAADAKATGDAITAQSAKIEVIDDTFRIDTSTEINLSNPDEYGSYSISPSTGKWSSKTGRRFNFYSRPEGAETIEIKSNATNGSVLALLKSTTRSANTYPDYATGCSRTFISAGNTARYDLPSDCNYIGLFDHDENSVSYIPVSVTVPSEAYTDKTLTLDGKAADAKTVGDKFSKLDNSVDTRIAQQSGNYSLSTDANYYVDKVPSYYITPETTPTSFAEVNGYLDNKIASIPKDGKHFIFITDTHWDGNEKHSPDLIAYIRERTGINKVLFGGDVFGNATNKYLAAKKASGYLLPSKRSTGYDFIPCVGDHDSNTVNVTSDAEHFLPYSQIEELFVGDLERHPSYHFYDCSEKLSEFATVGSDDYNEAMAFFHTVYYVDDVVQHIRFVSLNCGNGGNYGAMYNIFGASGTSLMRLQFDWLVDVMMSTQSGWDLVILSHKGNGANGGVAADILNNIIYYFRIKYASASGNPSSDTAAIEQWWPHNWSYNFSNAPDVRYIIAINGHEHADRLMAWGKVNGTYSKDPSYVTSGSTINQPNGASSYYDVQFPLIVTSCDSIGVTGAYSPSMTAGTVTEQCFDVITITDTGLVMTRIGAGDDRSLTITRNA